MKNLALIVAMLLAVCGTVSRGQSAPAATATLAAGAVTPCPAYIKVEGKQAKVLLVGAEAGKVLFCLGDSPMGQRRELPVEKVETAYFEYKMDYGALNKAVYERKWGEAARIMLPSLGPTLPFLNLADNNAVEQVLEMGSHMYRAAMASLDAAATEEQKEKAREQVKAAFAVFTKLGKAEWSSTGMLGKLKSFKCLIALEKPKTARKLFDELPPPAPGDRAYGLYWLLKGEMDFADGLHRDAMQAAVNSLCFENKDVDTFPDALLLSAQCYEEFQEWHRARDVYYETAKIFPDTDWAEGAVRRLHFIMDRGLTKEEEKSAVETVFFGLKEDMNKKVKDLFEELASGRKRVFGEPEEDKTPVVDEVDKLNLDEPDE
ncbi:MAG: hypothetical protein FJ224_04180 [Lentisphaerae bacterium]|nr:hypothetical protein [Lentisphaerota bacterium]